MVSSIGSRGRSGHRAMVLAGARTPGGGRRVSMRDGGLWIGVVYGIATSLVALVIGVGCGVWLYGCTVERIILNETVYYPAPKATP